MQSISKFILFTLFKWKIIGEFPSDCKQYVLIAAPHTCWIDIPIGILIRSITQTKISFIGKKSLFKNPQGVFFRWLGGFAVDRTKSTNMVASLIHKFKENENFILCLSPEGTRKKVKNWKSGYYYIAKGAGVPIVKLALDFKSKHILIDAPYYLTDDKNNDMKTIRGFYHGISGRYPELS